MRSKRKNLLNPIPKRPNRCACCRTELRRSSEKHVRYGLGLLISCPHILSRASPSSRVIHSPSERIHFSRSMYLRVILMFGFESPSSRHSLSSLSMSIPPTFRGIGRGGFRRAAGSTTTAAAADSRGLGRLAVPRVSMRPDLQSGRIDAGEAPAVLHGDVGAAMVQIFFARLTNGRRT